MAGSALAMLLFLLLLLPPPAAGRSDGPASRFARGSAADAGSPSRTSAGRRADPVIAAAGDIACDPTSGRFNGGDGTDTACRQRYTGRILRDLHETTNLRAILPLGDAQYECGGLREFERSYALSWGASALKSISRPVPGNHEYLARGGTGCSATADGYYSYFGAAAGRPSGGYYSFDVGSWHLIALNSECKVASCGAGSAQERWLRADLAASDAACTLAYWHRPRFSSGRGGGTPEVAPFWRALYEAGAEIVLVAHFHAYEAFAPQTPAQRLDSRGLRQFIVGTGGNGLSPFGTVAPHSRARNNKTFGVLKLRLHEGSYDWRFVPETGAAFSDAGSGTCHR